MHGIKSLRDWWLVPDKSWSVKSHFEPRGDSPVPGSVYDRQGEAGPTGHTAIGYPELEDARGGRRDVTVGLRASDVNSEPEIDLYTFNELAF